ncbi:MAG: class I SAM-dependent methyltransferase [Aristaeellaceae bacterium]
MNEVNKTLFIPLYGKSKVSRQGVILHDPMAEKIWGAEGFPMHGKSKSKWLAYNMAMRARVFDDWTEAMLRAHPNALVLHVGCGLDSRCLRVKVPYQHWIDADFPDVLALRERYYAANDTYHMMALDAAKPEQIAKLPESETAIVVLEGISMYLTSEQVHGFLQALARRYARLHILMDVYTVFAAKASKYKNPVNEVGVTQLYGLDDIQSVLHDTGITLKAEHSFTPEHLIHELKPLEQAFFKTMFAGSLYRKLYRLYELERSA